MNAWFWFAIAASQLGNCLIQDDWWRALVVVPLLVLAGMIYGFERGRESKCERI